MEDTNENEISHEGLDAESIAILSAVEYPEDLYDFVPEASGSDVEEARETDQEYSGLDQHHLDIIAFLNETSPATDYYDQLPAHLLSPESRSDASGSRDPTTPSDDYSEDQPSKVASDAPQDANPPSENETQNGRKKRRRSSYVDKKALNRYWPTHPAVVRPLNPAASPVRHPRALTLILHEGPPSRLRLGTPPRPHEQGRLGNPDENDSINQIQDDDDLNNRSRDDSQDEDEESRPRSRRRLG
ncbi:hypothetical protein PGTUg99_016536 [Puccinia graminis f. sp. tritici]|uniref:Uncharacterized protein n=2 Tax=Puccinia graminis f. sp. tritici TaxID=56615 RepID=E3KFD8_PUCGT|nr:uncharacterized protein PGTG_09933 [Puccinia graminis f. sp. tritici CRL 75-36-700-3]EFP82965.1 hypothetical protein PGTG_09933 [Puccinia graminis f. sp. tritici CRL 75-36-700-3]KAA1075496.1 hypothetical protein PGTUg99_016536 [Puccinia graminis f. sp. tritici]